MVWLHYALSFPAPVPLPHYCCTNAQHRLLSFDRKASTYILVDSPHGDDFYDGILHPLLFDQRQGNNEGERGQPKALWSGKRHKKPAAQQMKLVSFSSTVNLLSIDLFLLFFPCLNFSTRTVTLLLFAWRFLHVIEKRVVSAALRGMRRQAANWLRLTDIGSVHATPH